MEHGNSQTITTTVTNVTTYTLTANPGNEISFV